MSSACKRALLATVVALFLGSATQAGTTISFTKSTLSGESSTNLTSLQFGPDDRLYVAQQDGLIRIYTVQRNGPTDYQVSATETITAIQAIPNHDDDGQLNAGVNTRQVTGLLVAGTASNPVIYVGSSDPRIGGGGGSTNTNLDTNSGIISRLTWNGTTWDKLDLVRGLPRSEENHASNGMQLDNTNHILFVMQGGHTNMGAPSNNFVFTPEYSLSAALLAIDLAAIGETTYDLPTLDDEDQPGDPDPNDPFGGNNGKNQALLVPGGPVQVYSPGWRNAYDVVVTEAGRMYTVDNGPNSNWGDVPAGEGPAGTCTNSIGEPGATHVDRLHQITGQGYYGGHPNPTRANMANTFNPTNPQSPVTAGNPVECDYRTPGVDDGALALYPASTNGICEYTASNFSNAMQGDLLLASFDNKIYRAVLTPAGDGVILNEALLSSVGNHPLDVTAQGDFDIFPGTIWVAMHGGNNVVIYEPVDFSECTGADDTGVDEDGDGYTNADEIDNGTSPCSPGDVPPDADGDLVSDLNDPDDDDDGLPDTSDPFAIDADNGTTTALPVIYTWENDAPAAGGILNLGFTGLMTNGTDDYATLFDPTGKTAGGAAGVFTIDSVSEGDARDGLNNQAHAHQFGVDVDASSGVFTAHTRMVAPFNGITPEDHQSMGLFIGTGAQDNYVKLVLDAAGGVGGIELGIEQDDIYADGPSTTVTMPGPESVDLYLTIDAAAHTVQAAYAINQVGMPGSITLLGTPQSIPASWLGGPYGLAAGLISTSRGTARPFAASWDLIEVTPGAAGEVCFFDSDCDDTIACTLDECTSGQCINTPQDAECDDGLSCTNDTCDALLDCQNASTCSAGDFCSAVTDSCEPLSAEAFIIITPSGGIDASTYGNGTMQISNNSVNAVRISAVSLDLSSALFPDIVFDPVGLAGDVVAKCLSSNSGAAATGYLAPADPCVDPFFGPHDGGYDGANLAFSEFDPGETFTFSVDIDPTSIQGGSTSGAAGSVSGLEMTGAVVIVDFDNGETITSTLFRTPASTSGGENIFKAGSPPAPGIAILGIPGPPAIVANPNQIVRLSGTPGSTIRLFRVEGELELVAAPGFDLDPFEANTAVILEEFTTVLNGSGIADVPVILTSNTTAALNHFVAAVQDDDGSGRMSPASDVIVLELDGTGGCTADDQCADSNPCTNDACTAGSCDNTELPDGTTCDDGNPATINDQCTAGACQGVTDDADNDGIADAGDPCPADALNRCYGPVAVDQTLGTAVRINCSTGEVCSGDRIDCNGDTWYADFGFNVGSSAECNLSGGCPMGGLNEIFGIGCAGHSATEAILQCERWDASAAPELLYDFDVPDGNYLVNMLYANTYTGTDLPEERVFDIVIENVLIFDDFDAVIAANGSGIAVVRAAVIQVNDGDGLQIELLHETQNPAIKGIEVLAETTCTPLGPDDTTCDGIDDDCDDSIDEDYTPVLTNCGTGSCAATGSTACVDGAVVDDCTPGTPAPDDSTCDGVDDDCDDIVDEDYDSISTQCGVGACAATGTTACVDGAVVDDCTPGTPAPDDSTCDGVDDDCDDIVDEDYDSISTQCGVGACAATGSTACVDGAVVDDCTPGTPAPDDSTCDGVDDDCDDIVDEDYVSISTQCGVGACAATGTTACVDGAVVDDCAPGTPAPDDTTCDGVDDDCDDIVDEDYVSISTQCGVGACAATGTTACVDGAVVDDCAPGTPAPDDSTCDGVDDDCDDIVDEDYVSISTQCGVGACAATGSTTCVDGAVVDDCAPGTPAPDDSTCDGVDDDCDDIVDEDYDSIDTQCGVGACAATGSTACVDGAVVDDCAPGTPAPDDTTCDGVDDDCDDIIDEDYDPISTQCGVGACAATGSTACVDGAVVDDCTPGTPSPDDTTCDGVDDDCDDIVDEDYDSIETQCGVGACAATGSTACVDGAVVDDCLPGKPQTETCDGLDNDCNDTVDDEPAASAFCDDGLFCNGAESCFEGRCARGPEPCLDDFNCLEDRDTCLGCAGFEDCADLDANGVRDDGCVWWACTDGNCLGTSVTYGDIGGEFGACPPDGIADGNDRFHALNCFANEDPATPPPNTYPCETAAPVALNVDAGGPFGNCAPDGVCDGNDAFAVLAAFAGESTCACPGGPGPQFDPIVVDQATLELTPAQTTLAPGETIDVAVHLTTPLGDLRGYQLHVGVAGGVTGTLELIDIHVQDVAPTPTKSPHRSNTVRNHVRHARPPGDLLADGWAAFNVTTHQVVVGNDAPGLAVAPGYLATFTFRATQQARGTFEVAILHHDDDPMHRTFLFPSRLGDKITILRAAPAEIRVR